MLNGFFNRYFSSVRVFGKSQLSGSHLVDPSPWPFVVSVNIGGFMLGLVCYFYGFGLFLSKLSFLALSLSLFYWFRDIIREGLYEGHHVLRVQVGFRLAFLLFIVSEVMFFFALFWGYYWFSFSSGIGVGGVWFPPGISSIDPVGLPLVNTLLLLLSGFTATVSHHSVVLGFRYLAIISLVQTVFLALLFTLFQLLEYTGSSFSISDSVYGSSFYLTTGFHGFHVIIGTLMLLVALVRILGYSFTQEHHVGFEGSLWYWHFVDVVWLWLFISIYVWS